MHSRFQILNTHLIRRRERRSYQSIPDIESHALHGSVVIHGVGFQRHSLACFKFRSRRRSRKRNACRFIALPKALIVLWHFSITSANTDKIRNFFRKVCNSAFFERVIRSESLRSRNPVRHLTIITMLLFCSVSKCDTAKIDIAIIAPFREIALSVIDVAVFVTHISLCTSAVAVCARDKKAIVIDILVVQMNLRAVIFASHLRHATVSIVPIIVRISQVSVFN